jgi:adenylylsulfate reductase subunit A
MGGSMAACAAACEPIRWAAGTNLKIERVDKAALSRSGAVAQGLSAIDTYVGENDPANCVRYDRLSNYEGTRAWPTALST